MRIQTNKRLVKIIEGDGLMKMWMVGMCLILLGGFGFANDLNCQSQEISVNHLNSFDGSRVMSFNSFYRTAPISFFSDGSVSFANGYFSIDAKANIQTNGNFVGSPVTTTVSAKQFIQGAARNMVCDFSNNCSYLRRSDLPVGITKTIKLVKGFDKWFKPIYCTQSIVDGLIVSTTC